MDENADKNVDKKKKKKLEINSETLGALEGVVGGAGEVPIEDGDGGCTCGGCYCTKGNTTC